MNSERVVSCFVLCLLASCLLFVTACATNQGATANISTAPFAKKSSPAESLTDLPAPVTDRQSTTTEKIKGPVIDAASGSKEVYVHAAENGQYNTKGMSQAIGQKFLLHFDVGEASLDASSLMSLKRIATLLDQNPGTFAHIEGHSDSVGKAIDNQRLSMRRARQVQTLLLSHHAISLERSVVKGYGEIRPLATNDTKEGRARNRRVEVTILSPGSLPNVFASHENQSLEGNSDSPAKMPVPSPQPHEIASSQPTHPGLSIHNDNLQDASVTYTPLQAKQAAPMLSGQEDTSVVASRMDSLGSYQPKAQNLQPHMGLDSREVIDIAAVGDIMMGSAYQANALPPDDGEKLFSHVAHLFKGADVVFGNLEGPLADSGEGQKCTSGSENCYEFRTPTRYVQHLVRAGFNTVSIANNHGHDFGPAGQQSTLDTLRSNNIHPAGGEAVAHLTMKGKRIAVVGFAHRGRRYAYPIQDIPLAKRIVSELKKNHDLVIVSFHGGAEGSGATQVTDKTEMFLGENRGNVVAFAHAVIDAGASLVLGHGPHVLRAMEVYKGHLIAYSLGNFLTYELFSTRGSCGLSAVLRLQLDAETGKFVTGKMAPIRLTAQGLPRPDPDMAAARQIVQLTQEYLALTKAEKTDLAMTFDTKDAGLILHQN